MQHGSPESEPPGADTDQIQIQIAKTPATLSAPHVRTNVKHNEPTNAIHTVHPKRSTRSVRTSKSRHGHNGLAVAACILATLALCLGCGTKSPLRVPEAVPDAMDAQHDAQCIPGRFVLERRQASVLFVIDRSRSMRFSLDGQEEVPREAWRWTALRNALASALPPFEHSLMMGALFFPDEQGGSTCSILRTAGIDIHPDLRNTDAILAVLDRTEPWGGTPTYEALRRAHTYLLSRMDRTRSAHIVLATDGAPNCNPDLPSMNCVCTFRPDPTDPRCPSHNCLDDVRTIAAIATIARSGTPVYVIGIDDPSQPDLNQVLHRMAIAGGRPNTEPGQPAYYSVRSTDALVRAFTSIQRSITQCTFVTPSRPDNPDDIRIEVNGIPIPRDETHRNGWDWTDQTFGELAFFGPACDQISDTTAVVAQVGCSDGG